MGIELAQVYTDFNGLEALKAKAREDRDEAVDEVSRQFESLFMQMMLKSMRKAGFGGGLLDSQQSGFYRDMYDQQLSMDLSRNQGMGLAEVISRQLGGSQAASTEGKDVAAYREQPVPRAIAAESSQPIAATAAAKQAGAISDMDGTPSGFIRALWPAAEKAASELGLPPQALIAQAALETGWGKHVMSRPDGSSSHNLFGIKADRRWSGDKVGVSTLEYRDGVAMRTRADFRAYNSWEDSFQDYVSFVKGNPRYRDAIRSTDDVPRYFEQLQKAGYATDPSYAHKITRILDREFQGRSTQQGTGV